MGGHGGRPDTEDALHIGKSRLPAVLGWVALVIGLGFKFAKVQEPPRGEVFASFWRDPDVAEDYGDDSDASSAGAAAPAPAG